MDIHSNLPYSSEVSIHLEVGDVLVPIGAVLRDEIRLRESVEFPANTKGVLVIVIDGNERREDIILQDGISRNSDRVKFLAVN